MEVKRSEVTPYETLVAQLESLNHRALKSVQRDPLVNEITTKVYETGNYKVYLTESGFVADLVLTLQGYYLHLSFLDAHTVMLGATHRLGEAPQDLQATVNAELLNQVKYNITIGQDYGRYPQNRGKTLTVWNFHNHTIYLAR